jgi:hypothetical protein
MTNRIEPGSEKMGREAVGDGRVGESRHHVRGWLCVFVPAGILLSASFHAAPTTRLHAGGLPDPDHGQR